MHTLFPQHRAYVGALGVLVACVLFISIPTAGATPTLAPSATNTLYLPVARLFRPSGALVVEVSNAGIPAPNDIAVLDAASFQLSVLGTGMQPAWSPDRSKIAFFAQSGQILSLHLMNDDGSGRTKLSSTPVSASDTAPIWSPDGTKILFSVSPTVLTGYWAIINADGTGERSLFGNLSASDPVWSPDGTKIAFAGPDYDIYVMNADGTGVKFVADTNFCVEPWPQWSPDGTKIAFVAYPNSRYSIYVVNADGTGVKRLTNGVTPSYEPAWSPDGSKIAFAAERSGPANNLVVMNADGSDARVVWTNHVLMHTWSPDDDYIGLVSWDPEPGIWAISADGAVQANLSYAARPSLIAYHTDWRP